MRQILSFILLIFSGYLSLAQPRTDPFLQKLFASNHNTVFNQVIQQPDSFRLQIIYTQINRDKNNKPLFTNYYFHYDPQLYFNPASMVKMPLAFLALEKLNHINKKKLTNTLLFRLIVANPGSIHCTKTFLQKIVCLPLHSLSGGHF